MLPFLFFNYEKQLEKTADPQVFASVDMVLMKMSRAENGKNSSCLYTGSGGLLHLCKKIIQNDLSTDKTTVFVLLQPVCGDKDNLHGFLCLCMFTKRLPS